MPVIKSSRWSLPPMNPEEKRLNDEILETGKEVRRAMEKMLPRRRMHWGAIKSHVAVEDVEGLTQGDLLFQKQPVREEQTSRSVNLWLERRNRDNDEPIALVGYDQTKVTTPAVTAEKKGKTRIVQHERITENQNTANTMLMIDADGRAIDSFNLSLAPSLRLLVMQYVHDTLPLMLDHQEHQRVRSTQASVVDLPGLVQGDAHN